MERTGLPSTFFQGIVRLMDWNSDFQQVIFFTPGEVPADEYVGYLTDLTLTGLLGIELEAAVVVVERKLYFDHHCRLTITKQYLDRNWGASLPTQIIDTAHLQQHTLENAVQDFVRFAQEVDFPFDKNHSSNAPQAVSCHQVPSPLTGS